MTHECFIGNINRIQKTFNGIIPGPRLDMIKQKFMHLPEAAWIKICDHIIGYERALPTMKDFDKHGEEFLKIHKKAYALGEIQPNEIAKCFDCGDSGFVRLVILPTAEKWAKCSDGSAPCHCARGKELIKAALRRRPPMDLGGQYNELWHSSYKIVPQYKQETELHHDACRGTNEHDKQI